MEYSFEVRFSLSPWSTLAAEILQARMLDLHPDGIREESAFVLAYFSESSFFKNKLDIFIQEWDFTLGGLSYEINKLENKNWNEQWERNFKPVIIDQICMVRALHHNPRKDIPYEIIIEPKMSFGTGHHETTLMMIRSLLNVQLRDREVLDMGCGTGILSILASKLQAKQVIAIDTDSIAYTNTLENIKLNKVKRIQVIKGDASVIPNQQVDLLLANINLNVLQNDLLKYYKTLRSSGDLILSGFLCSDADVLLGAAKKLGLIFKFQDQVNQWILLRFEKKS